MNSAYIFQGLRFEKMPRQQCENAAPGLSLPANGRFSFLSLVNALFTTLGEMCGCRKTVTLVDRIVHDFSEHELKPRDFSHAG